MLNQVRHKILMPEHLPRAQTFALLFAVWLILDGWDTAWLGVLLAATGTFLAINLVPEHRHVWLTWKLIAFEGYFLWESFRGGVDVAARVLHPRLRIDPEFRRHTLVLPAGEPRILMISLVSLLPGTLSADLEDGDKTLIVHILMPSAEDSIYRLEKWIEWLFSLPGEST